jgi:hypothetical protein
MAIRETLTRCGFVRFVGSTLLFAASVCSDASAQSESGPYARIGVLRPHDGDTLEFEAGYVRHLDWHRQAHDPWVWYGWTISIGERPRGFVYATFGHSATSLDNPVSPAADEADTIPNITPHAHFLSTGVYEFLPALSRGTGVPQPASRVEFTTIELVPGGERAFEEAVAAEQSTLKGETLWYRMISGGRAPCYVRLRPRPSLSATLGLWKEQPFPERVNSVIAQMTVEVLTLRPTMSYGLPADR